MARRRNSTGGRKLSDGFRRKFSGFGEEKGSERINLRAMCYALWLTAYGLWARKVALFLNTDIQYISILAYSNVGTLIWDDDDDDHRHHDNWC